MQKVILNVKIEYSLLIVKYLYKKFYFLEKFYFGFVVINMWVN